MFNNKITLAVVAARKGSRGLKNKNFLKLNGKSIVRLAVELSLQCRKINKVVFTSDSKKILKLVSNKKNLIKLKRSSSLAKNNTPMLPVLKDAINYFEKKNNFKLKVSKVIIIDPTSPLRKIDDINKAIEVFKRKKLDLLVSVHRAEHNPYFSVLEKNGKYYQLLKTKYKNPGSRQAVPNVYEINTIVWIYSRNAILKSELRIPKKTSIIITPKERSIDIDNRYDFNKIKHYLKFKNHKLN